MTVSVQIKVVAWTVCICNQMTSISPERKYSSAAKWAFLIFWRTLFSWILNFATFFNVVEREVKIHLNFIRYWKPWNSSDVRAKSLVGYPQCGYLGEKHFAWHNSCRFFQAYRTWKTNRMSLKLSSYHTQQQIDKAAVPEVARCPSNQE